MGSSRKKADWPIVAALAASLLLAGTLGLYVSGYFAMGALWHDDADSRHRCFDAEWKVSLFRPAGTVESVFIGREVILYDPPLIVDEVADDLDLPFRHADFGSAVPAQ